MTRYEEQCNKVLEMRSFREETSVKHESNSMKTTAQSVCLELFKKIDLELLKKQ